MRRTGHIRERSPGAWEVRYSLGSDAATGKRRVATATVHGDRKDAQRELRRLLRTIDTGEHVDPTKMKVRDHLKTWLETVRERISPKSHERYTEIVENFLIPELGALAIGKLTPTHIQTAYTKWSTEGRRDGKEGGLAPSTRKYIHRVLRSSLSCAVEQQVIARNPADAFRNRLPKAERKTMNTLSPAQSAALLGALEGNRIYMPVYLALATGMRRGEVLALRWRNVDFGTREVRVVESLEQSKAGLRFKPPKTDRTRAIAMPDFLAAELRRCKTAQAETLLKCGVRQAAETLVCCNPDGTPFQPRSLTHAFSREIAHLTELPKVRFHDLRHSHATQLLEAGVHPKVAQERLGHSAISTTLDLYSHVTPTMQRDAAERLDAGLGNAISAVSASK